MAVTKSERKEWAKENMKGIENILPPSLGRGGLDEPGIRLDVQQSIKHGFSSTLCPTKEAGLDVEKVKRFLDIVSSEAKGAIRIGVSLSFDTFEEDIQLLQHAEKVGCTHAVLNYPLNFNPASEEEIYHATRNLCDATNLSIVLLGHNEKLDFFRFHPSGIPLELYSRMADIENVVALQMASSESGLLYECFERLGNRILVSCSFFGMLPLLMEIYGQQWIGGNPFEAFQSPQKRYAVDFFHLLQTGKKDEAMKLYWHLVPAMVVFNQLTSASTQAGADHWPLIKYYQWCVGGNGGLLRGPNVYQRDFDAIRSAYLAIGIEPAAEPDKEFFAGRSQKASPARA
ncbi:MAG: hypothetical protein HY645_14585 [Acidobacteria bacterium]|nr:hypothetical protein [Acidobacteriota bacterium]